MGFINWLKNGFEFVGDVLSGRAYGAFGKLFGICGSLDGRIQTLEERIIKMTEQEQSILDAAAKLGEVAAKLRTSFTGLEAKIAQLQAQAQAPVSTPVPTDISSEMIVLNQAISGLDDFSDSLRDAVSTGTPVSAPIVPDPSTSPIVPNPVMANPDTGEFPPHPSGQPIPAEPTPLAGQTGATSTPTDSSGTVIPVDDTQVFADQQQPGSNPVQQPDGGVTGPQNQMPDFPNSATTTVPAEATNQADKPLDSGSGTSGETTVIDESINQNPAG